MTYSVIKGYLFSRAPRNDTGGEFLQNRKHAMAMSPQDVIARSETTWQSVPIFNKKINDHCALKKRSVFLYRRISFAIQFYISVPARFTVTFVFILKLLFLQTVVGHASYRFCGVVGTLLRISCPDQLNGTLDYLLFFILHV